MARRVALNVKGAGPFGPYLLAGRVGKAPFTARMPAAAPDGIGRTPLDLARTHPFARATGQAIAGGRLGRAFRQSIVPR